MKRQNRGRKNVKGLNESKGYYEIQIFYKKVK